MIVGGIPVFFLEVALGQLANTLQIRFLNNIQETIVLLNDVDVLGECIPGCEEVNKSGEDGFAAKVVFKIGPVKVKMSVSANDRAPFVAEMIESRLRRKWPRVAGQGRKQLWQARPRDRCTRLQRGQGPRRGVQSGWK